MRHQVASALLLATVVAACAGGEGAEPDATPSASVAAPTPTVTEPPAQVGIGVSAEPCPDGAPDRGCIHLAVLSDLSSGPFFPFGAAVSSGVEAFWADVNADGGIAGFDVDVTTHTRDTAFDPATHATAMTEVAGDVLAVAMSLGTEPTLAALDALPAEHADLQVVPGSFWSGWWDDPRALPSGADYCTQAANGLARLAATPADTETEASEGESAEGASAEGEVLDLVVVRFDDLYGRDVAAGVAAWAADAGVPFDPAEQDVLTQIGVEGAQDPAVEAVLERSPDVLVVATGPLELASIVAKLDTQGFEGRILAPAVAFTPGVLAEESLAALYTQRVNLEIPWQPWGAATVAHGSMARALDGELPPNDGFTFGWVWSYPLKSLLLAAAEADDLTRAGLVAAREGLQVGYEDALPARTLSDAPPMVSLSAVPDPDAPLGVRGTSELGSPVAAGCGSGGT